MSSWLCVEDVNLLLPVEEFMRRALACLETTLAGWVWGEAAGLKNWFWEYFAAVPQPPVSWALQGALAQAPAPGGEGEEKPEEGLLCDGVTVCQGQCDLSTSPPLSSSTGLPGSVTGSCLPATIAGCAQEFVKLPPVPSSCYLCSVAPTPCPLQWLNEARPQLCRP